MKNAWLVVAMMWVGCPGAPGVDAGTGGGTGGGGGGTSSGGGTGGGAGGIDLAEYCAKYLEASCAFSVRCGAATPGVDCQKLAVPQRFSLINARQDCLNINLRAALDAGRAVYDGTLAQGCFDAVKNAVSCNATFQFFNPACGTASSQIFTGITAFGGPCYSNSDCALGLFCTSTTNTCPATCSTAVNGPTTLGPSSCAFGTFYNQRRDGGASCLSVVNLGDDCASPPGEFAPRLCAGATSCQSATDGGSTCQPFKTAGMRCDPFGFGECAMDTTCAGGDDGGTQCVALKRIGEQCAGGGLGVPCQAGLSCTNQLCSALVAPGGTCFEDQDCVAGHGCGIGGVCQPYGGPDAGCNTANFQDDCAVGLFCNSTSARCERRRGLDALCTGNECSLERGLTCVGGVGGGVSHCRPAFCLGP